MDREGSPEGSPGRDDRARLTPAQELALLVVAVVAVVGLAVATGVVSPDLPASIESGLDPSEGTDEPQPAVPEGTLTPVPTVEASPVTPAPTATATREADNPWGRERVVVAVDDRTDLNRSFDRAVRAAIDYWARHPELADYPAEFVLRPDAEDPDVLVRYAETFVCGDHGDPKGCAPVLSADARPPDPVVVQIGATEDGNFRTDRNAAIHELGHVLGVGHCEAPAWVMATGCSDAPATPNASERGFAWRDSTLRVHLDYGSVEDNRSAVEAQVRLALAAFAAGEGAAPANLTFRRVAEPYLADVAIRLGAEDGCAPGSRACATFAGADLDGDDAIEYHTRASVTLAPLPVRETGWHLGRWLAKVLTPGSLPDRFLSLAGEGPWWAGLAGTTDATANATDGEAGALDRVEGAVDLSETGQESERAGSPATAGRGPGRRP